MPVQIPVWDDGEPVQTASAGRCMECEDDVFTRYVVSEGAPADLENGPSEDEIPFIVCAKCFWSLD